MSVLVTGSTGFIGSYVVEELLNRGEDVITTSRTLEGAKSSSWFGKTKHILFDIDNEIVDNLFIHFLSPNIVIHLAWADLDNYNSINHIEKYLFSHYKFIKNLLDNGLKNITISGTCFEYGLLDGCLSEEEQTSPVTTYGLAKDTLHKFLLDLQKRNPFNMNWLRYFYMYGAGQNRKSLLAQLESAIDDGNTEFNMSGGEQLRDYLPVEKVAEYSVNIALHREYLGTINICSGTPISVRKLVEDRVTEFRANMRLNLGYYPYPNYEPMAFWGDSNKLSNALNHD